MPVLNKPEYINFQKNFSELLSSGNEFVKESKPDDIDAFMNLLDRVIARDEPGLQEALDEAYQLSRLCVKEVGLGVTSAISAMLYVFYNYRLISLETIEKAGIDEVVEIIYSLLKIADFGINKSSSQADNFRNLLLSLAKDVRVILIKLAEKLLLMRNLKVFDREDQIKISHEAFYLYAPLGHRLGLYKLKSEMEDLALKFTENETYKDIANKLNQTATARKKFIADFIKPIENRLNEEGFIFEIKGRPKSIFSIYQKMKKTNVSFEEVYDKFAIRIILDSKAEQEKSDCWRVYSIVTESYQPNPQRLRDWISVPKTNGYESLHTTVVVPGGKWVEIQIRTRRMDEIAERGFAAHWMYKGQKADNALDNWLGKVRDILDSPDTDSSDIIDEFKLSLYHKEIFIFTPKGDLKKFPKGASVLDFAFDIHTEVGANCAGALVNGKNVPIRYKLQNGDRVEILTSKNQKPKLDWLNIVVTGKAKSKIKQTLNAEKVKDAELGKDLIKRRFKNWKFGYNDTLINILLKHYKINTSLDFYYLVANEKIDLSEIKDVLTRAFNQEDKEEFVTESRPVEKQKIIHSTDQDYLIIDRKLLNIDYKLAKCCNPVFGDEIFGFVTISNGIKIHRVNCPNASQLHSRYNYRIVQAKWKATDGLKTFIADIIISGIDEFGILSKINDLITQELNMNLRSINLNSNDGMFNGRLSVMVNDKKHLEGLLKRLNQLPGIIKVVRAENR